MRYFMLNKPKGYITARRDAKHRTVMDLFGECERDILHPVGRLDIDTEGLLILTDDGGLDNCIMQPGHHIEKCYRFMAMGGLDGDSLARLTDGIPLYGNGHIACRADVVIEERRYVADSAELFPENRRAKWMKNPGGSVVIGKITVTEGKRHQVKLMLKAAGCHVFALKRLSLGGLRLDMSLAPGEYRRLCADEVNLMYPGYLDREGRPTMGKNTGK